jgi:HAMP domain-containing protein
MLTNIKYRILILFGVLGVLPLGGFIAWQYHSSQEQLRQRSFEQLKSVREIKKKEIEWYFSKLREEAQFFAQSKLIINAMTDFRTAFFELQNQPVPADITKRLQQYYQREFLARLTASFDSLTLQSLMPNNSATQFLQNQYLIGTRAAMQKFPYFDTHNQYHNAISSFIDTYELYDLLLIEDVTGHIIYSVSKEVDFGTSLLTGPFANSNLGKLFRSVRYTGLETQTVMCDFERYLPSLLAPAAFIAAPIFDGEQKLGTLILQIPINKLDAITTGKKAWEDEGLGATGEAYIVGSDYLMRTDSRFIIESPDQYIEAAQTSGIATTQQIALMRQYKTTILFQEVRTSSVERAIAKISGTHTITDYRKREVLSSFTPLDIKDVKWALLAEIDADEVFGPINSSARTSLLMLSAVVVILFLSSIMLARTIYKPIHILAEGTRELGKGNYNVQFFIKSKDELGVLAGTFNDTIRSLREQREEILLKNMQLDQQRAELAAQAENLKSLNDTITEINRTLDLKVSERTERLQKQNAKLMEYAHYNSHRLRAPVATIMGLIQIISISSGEEQKRAIDLLNEAAKELDKVIHGIQAILEEAEFRDEHPVDR